MKSLLLLHGALGSSSQFDQIEKELKDNYKTHTITFSGHGRTPSKHHAFTIQNFAHEVLDWMNERQLSSIDIFGYSMGGYVALWLARFYPARVSQIFTLGTKLNWTEEESAKEIARLSPEKISVKVPAYAQALADLHGEHEWSHVVHQTASMMKDLGHTHLTDQDFIQIKADVLLGLGELDNMVTENETDYVHRLIANAQFKKLPGVQHPLERVPFDLLTKEIKLFFD